MTAGVGTALLLSGIGALPATAQDAGRALTVDYVSLYTASTKVTSTTGHHLLVSVYVSKQSGHKPTVSVTLRAPHESHTWSFSAPSSALKVNSSGKGSVTLSASAMGGYGKLALHVKPVGATKTYRCQGQVVSKSRPVKVSGVMFADTKSSGRHKWGKVGSKTRSFTFAKPSSVSWQYDNTATCPTPKSTCYASLFWDASLFSSTAYSSLTGGTSRKSSYLSGYRSVQLHKPAGAHRSDSVTAKAPAPKLTVANDGSAVLTAKLGKGSAKIAAPAGSDNSTPCGTGGKQEHSLTWSGSYTNGATSLKVPAQIFGAISMKNSASAGYISKTTIVG